VLERQFAICAWATRFHALRDNLSAAVYAFRSRAYFSAKRAKVGVGSGDDHVGGVSARAVLIRRDAAARHADWDSQKCGALPAVSRPSASHDGSRCFILSLLIRQLLRLRVQSW